MIQLDGGFISRNDDSMANFSTLKPPMLAPRMNIEISRTDPASSGIWSIMISRDSGSVRETSMARSFSPLSVGFIFPVKTRSDCAAQAANAVKTAAVSTRINNTLRNSSASPQSSRNLCFARPEGG